MDKTEKEERIRRRAYDLWCAAGWPKGRDQEHWEQARREIEEADELAASELTEPAKASKPGGAVPGKR